MQIFPKKVNLNWIRLCVAYTTSELHGKEKLDEKTSFDFLAADAATNCIIRTQIREILIFEEVIRMKYLQWLLTMVN